jgi:hypothetical protein
MAILISADDLKKTIPGYNPNQSHLVHSQSARLADAKFEEAIKTSEYKQVVLLSGGAASGKTEFMSEYLLDKPYIIVDGTLPIFEGAKIKARKAWKYGKNVKIVAVWPVDLKVAFAAFLQRDRKFPDEHFYRTHTQSRKTLLEIAESNLDVDIELYENHYDKDGLIFYKYTFDSKDHLIEELIDNQYTENEIINLITES